jgi:hypothetical protein
MYKQSSTVARLTNALALAAAGIVFTALPASAQYKQLPMEPLHETGQSVQPSFEGWWQNPDGTYSVLLGYFNRNTKQEIDVPIGPGNHIDPGGPDRGQPTHFYPRRHWGVFAMQLPKDTKPDQKFVWTLVANGLTMSVPMSINPLWNITPMSEIGIGNTPPTISLDEKGPSVQGPAPIVVTRTATVGTPLSLTVWAADDDKSLRPGGPPAGGRGGAGRGGAGRGGAAPAAPAADAPADAAQIAALAAAAGIDVATATEFMTRPSVGITWQKFRGPGTVTFAAAKPKVEKIPDGTIPKKDKFNGKATTTATFSEPGDYILRVYATDSSGEGGGGFLCCWTNAEVKVTVK